MSTLIIIGLSLALIFWRPPFKFSLPAIKLPSVRVLFTLIFVPFIILGAVKTLSDGDKPHVLQRCPEKPAPPTKKVQYEMEGSSKRTHDSTRTIS